MFGLENLLTEPEAEEMHLFMLKVLLYLFNQRVGFEEMAITPRNVLS
jgi:hypothetical protein